MMAVHITIGLLFLGGGRCTLSTGATSVGALLAAFFPKFPTHTEDNRYHLQAFRHLYVLAVEPRLILPRDLNTGKLCYAHIQVVDLQGVSREMLAPCMLPELDALQEVRLHDPRYWPVLYQRHTNWDQLQRLLAHTHCVDIKPRAGCLSYQDDPHGFKTILAQSLTLDKANVWSASPEDIQLFTSDDKIRSFTKHYLSILDASKESAVCPDCMLDRKKKKPKADSLATKKCQCRQYSAEDRLFVQGLSMATYECVLKDVLCALPATTTILKILKTMSTEPTAYHIWQIKLLLSHAEHHSKKTLNAMTVDEDTPIAEPLISNEFTQAISQRVAHIFDSCEAKLSPFLRKYLGLLSSRKINNCDDSTKKILSAYLVYHDIPKGALWDRNCGNTLALLLELDSLNLHANTICKLGTIL